jgi:chemotaxis protein MotB
MARRNKKTHPSAERWLVSYADLLTLLFAFFVVLFASTQTDRSRASQISQAVEKAFRSSSIPPQIAAILGGSVDDTGHGNAQLKGPAFRPAEKSADEAVRQLDLTSAIKTLRSTLGAEMKQGQVKIHIEPRGAVISLNAQSVFPSGGDTIDSSVYPLVAKVAFTLNQLPNPIRLEGNTDSLPISNDRFRSNWELSAARSIAMMRMLTDRYGVGRERMAIVGYADNNAIADNSTEEGRMKNRRVDLVILSDYGTRSEPDKYLAAPQNCPPVLPDPTRTVPGH